MVLYAVYQFLRMLKAHAHGYAFGVHLHAAALQHGVYVAGGMSGGKNHRAAEATAVVEYHAVHTAVGS